MYNEFKSAVRVCVRFKCGGFVFLVLNQNKGKLLVDCFLCGRRFFSKININNKLLV